MAYFTSDRHLEMMVDYLRRQDGPAVLQDALSGKAGMAYKTAFKAITTLVEEGVVEKEEEVSPKGHKRFLYILKEWYQLTDEQRERAIKALERIADAMDRRGERERLEDEIITCHLRQVLIGMRPTTETKEDGLPKPEAKRWADLRNTRRTTSPRCSA